MISVIIATKDRPEKLNRCLSSFTHQSEKDFEIVVINQGAHFEIDKTVLYHLPSYRYIHNSKKGKSKALNVGISHARGSILAFTDDDCIASNTWIHTIKNMFRTHEKISAIFGKTVPFEPNKHIHETCPSIFLKKKMSVITRPCIHYEQVGFGNNMAIRASVFQKVGKFSEWLGPGSIGSNAEDADIILRMLTRNYQILYCPRMLVSHNKWLNAHELYIQGLSYTCGELACYMYYQRLGHTFPRELVLRNFRDSYTDCKKYCKAFYYHHGVGQLRNIWKYCVIKNIYKVRGACVAIAASFFSNRRV